MRDVLITYDNEQDTDPMFGYPIKETREIVRCKDCKHGHITIDGEHCKWCDIIATHEPDGDYDGYSPNGYDPEPYFDADFFCAWGERRG